MSKWQCKECSFIYDPAEGDMESGVPADTKFGDLPENWVCPVCGVPKSMFVKMEE
jgi:rubredoxin